VSLLFVTVVPSLGWVLCLSMLCLLRIGWVVGYDGFVMSGWVVRCYYVWFLTACRVGFALLVLVCRCCCVGVDLQPPTSRVCWLALYCVVCLSWFLVWCWCGVVLWW